MYSVSICKLLYSYCFSFSWFYTLEGDSNGMMCRPVAPPLIPECGGLSEQARIRAFQWSLFQSLPGTWEGSLALVGVGLREYIQRDFIARVLH